MKTDGASGHLDLVLLGVLSHGPGHGYAVIAAVRELTNGTLELTEGSVYPALHRLEDLGLLASEWEPVGGRRRRVYSITATGRAALQTQRRGWQSLVSAVDSVLRLSAAPVGGTA
jgi:PadR family transcriptional regulator, regulatory protein PadR